MGINTRYMLCEGKQPTSPVRLLAFNVEEGSKYMNATTSKQSSGVWQYGAMHYRTYNGQ